MYIIYDGQSCIASFVSIYVAVLFFPDNDHGANNKCSTKKWKEADVYIHDILNVYRDMQCSDVRRCRCACMWYSRGI